MPTSSLKHSVIIDSDEAAEKLLEVLESSNKTEPFTISGSTERDALQAICAMAVDYDGYRTVEGLMSLIDDIVYTAEQGLNGESVYLTPAEIEQLFKEGEKDESKD